MVFSLYLIAFLKIVTLLRCAFAAPSLSIDDLALDEPARLLLKSAVPASPRFVIYSDKFIQNVAPSASDLKGYNVFILSFLLLNGAADQAQAWAQLDASQRTSILNQYHSAGISLIVSAFGSTDKPTTSGADPTSTANTMAQWVKQYGLDGIDVDYEDLDAFNAQDGSAENWLTTFTRQLRSQLPQGQYILSHAPQAPWFSAAAYGGGGYIAVNKNVGSLIDWYNIQFYNQGQNAYTTCDGLLNESTDVTANTAIFQISSSGVPLNKLLIGKPANTGDASNGYIDPNTLASCVAQAKNKGWSAGVMVWEYPDAGASWIQTVRSQSWPV